ncbi:MAG TPA: ABC transporter permease [Acidimicrobiales bacterium]|nr:ABC transporter permease [Acidimicrobiales bacterium]
MVGLFAGGAYALVAVSITLMFRSTGVLSFAHAAFAAVGAYVYADLAGAKGWPRPLAAVAALVITVVYGLIVERLAIRPVRSASHTTKLIATLGVMAFTTGLLLQIYGFEPTSSPLLLPDRNVRLGDLRVTYQQVAVVVMAAVLASALGAFLKRTRFGTAVRAVAQNAEASRLMGVSLTQIARFNWAVGAALAGLTGILIAPLQVITAGTFPLLLAKALTASLFGGLVSLPLTFVGGLVVGVAENLTVPLWSVPGAREMATLAIVVGLLLIRRSWPVDAEDEPSFDSSPVRLAAVEPVVAALRRALAFAKPLRWPLILGVTAFALAKPLTSNYWGFVGARGLFYVIEALSFVILVGWGGQVSLMHGAYVGIGAFTTAYLVNVHGVPLALAILGGATAGMVFGAIAGLPALRLTGLQFGIASLVFAGAASEWFFKRPEFPKELPRGHMFGIDLGQDSHIFAIMLVVTALLYLLVWNLRRSTFGPLLISARDSGPTVAHFGADPKRVRMQAFLLASFMAALGGGFYGVLLTGFQPFDFSLLLSIALLLNAVVGGITLLGGPLLAGILFGVVPQLIQGRSGTSASAVPDMLAGLAVIALLAFRPAGLAAMLRRAPAAAPATETSPVHLGRFSAAIETHERNHTSTSIAKRGAPQESKRGAPADDRTIEVHVPARS